MKKGILVAVLALLTSVVFVGCSQKSDDQENKDSDNTVVTTESEDKKEDSEENKSEDNDEKKDGDESEEAKSEDFQEGQGEPMNLGDQKVQGETVEGKVYDGNYRITNGPDRVVIEWSVDVFKNTEEYIFEGDKLVSVNFERTYASEEQAKTDYETISKQNEEAQKVKDLRLEGATIKYSIKDDDMSELKDYSKQKLFDEAKKTYEELSKVDDVRSDD